MQYKWALNFVTVIIISADYWCDCMKSNSKVFSQRLGRCCYNFVFVWNVLSFVIHKLPHALVLVRIYGSTLFDFQLNLSLPFIVLTLGIQNSQKQKDLNQYHIKCFAKYIRPLGLGGRSHCYAILISFKRRALYKDIRIWKLKYLDFSFTK